MKTRAQLRLEAAEQSQKKKSGKTKKEILEEKQQKKRKQGKAQGTKKVKIDMSVDTEPLKKEGTKGRGRSKKVQTKQSSTEKNPQQENRSRSQRKKPTSAKDDEVQKEDTKKVNPQEVKDKQNAKDTQSKKQPAKAGAQEKQEVKTFKFKGKVPIDQYCRLAKDPNYQILQHNNRIYSATLNQTSVKNNSNKFYILQIIQSSANTNHCYFFTRWGRVGVPGQQALQGPFNINMAIHQYNSKFREKHDKGDYRQVQLSYENEGQKKEETKKQKESNQDQDKQKTFDQSKLSKPVKKLIQLIFDLNMMSKQMVQIGYNVSKMPLGKLSQDNIKRGYNLLQSLMDQLKGKKRPQLIEQFTDDFYSYIPHDFGFMRMQNFILDTVDKVKKKIQMLQSLAQIKVATNLISSASDEKNEIDANYEKLQRDIKEVDPKSQLFSLLDKYLQTTHGSTHNNYILQLQDLFQLNHQGENIRYKKDIHNKMLLWHGSRLTNFVGILSQGLRIAPPQAPVTGYMFGKGVYFADMSSKSANYCFTSALNNTGILLLCEVALGNMNEKFHADYYASNLPADKHSTKGIGKTAPDPINFVKMSDEVVIPMGPGMSTAIPGAYLQYNQFIVYDVAQIRVRYLLRTRFNYKKQPLFHL